MTIFEHPDLVPLWDRPPDFLPLRPPGGSYRWSYPVVRAELDRVSDQLDKEQSERRVALLANPSLTGAAAAEGLHAGIQMLRAGELAAAHRHTPAALRIGLVGADVITMVDDEELPLDPLDVVLNPSGTWHGHAARGDQRASWLDVVDLPLVHGLGGVMFEPTIDHRTGALLDPPTTPSVLRYAWRDAEVELAAQESVSGVRTLEYGGGSVMVTLAVTAHAVEAGATLNIPARTGGAIVLIGRGSFTSLDGALDACDVVALRSWTPYTLTATSGDGVVMMIDTSPAMRALGLFREETTR